MLYRRCGPGPTPGQTPPDGASVKWFGSQVMGGMKEILTKITRWREALFDDSVYKQGAATRLSLDCSETVSSFEEPSDMTIKALLGGTTYDRGGGGQGVWSEKAQGKVKRRLAESQRCGKSRNET